MSKEVSFKNRDRFVQLGIAIAALRKMRGLSQEKLAERAGVSRSLISTIEAPNMAHGFSLDVFFDIADALEVGNVKKCAVGKYPKSEKPVRQSGGLLCLRPLPVLHRRQSQRVARIDPDAVVVDKNIAKNDRFDLFSR